MVEGCDVGVGHVSPGIEEVRLDGELSLGRDDVPRLELLDHRPNVLVFVTNVDSSSSSTYCSSMAATMASTAMASITS